MAANPPHAGHRRGRTTSWSTGPHPGTTSTPDDRAHRPILYGSPDRPQQEFWVIDGRGARLQAADPLGDSSSRSSRAARGYNVVTSESAREMDDVQLRLDHMDALGVDVQVLHNTLWITNVAERPETEAALCQRAGTAGWRTCTRGGGGRLRWSCVVPTLSLGEAVVQMRFARAHGAVGVCLRAHEAGRHLIDPYFYPLFEEAQRLDVPIVVHVSNADPWLAERLKSSYDFGSSFSPLRVPTVTSCHEYIMSEVPTLFPRLRWAFVEVSAQWVPWLVKEARRRARKVGRPLPHEVFPRVPHLRRLRDRRRPAVRPEVRRGGQHRHRHRLRPRRHLQRDRRHRHLPRDGLRRRRGGEAEDPLREPRPPLRTLRRASPAGPSRPARTAFRGRS